MWAAVSGPMSSGLAKGMSPWFSTIRPSNPAAPISARVGQRAFVDRLDVRAAEVRRSGQRQEMHDADEDALFPTEDHLQRIAALARDR